MELKDLEEMFKMEQELDIPYRDRWYNNDFDKRELEATQEVNKCNLPPVSNLMPELEKIVSSRIKDAFDNGMQNYEKNELQAALDTIKRLVPPSYFEGICC